MVQHDSTCMNSNGVVVENYAKIMAGNSWFQKRGGPASAQFPYSFCMILYVSFWIFLGGSLMRGKPTRGGAIEHAEPNNQTRTEHCKI